jgi:3-oxoacid CoA-transferase subunit B
VGSWQVQGYFGDQCGRPGNNGATQRREPGRRLRDADAEVAAEQAARELQTVTTLPTSSFFSSSASFAMIRGGRIDLAILGALEVAANGDLANWSVPGTMLKGMGGAMDLVAGVKRVVAVMSHTDKAGQPKIVRRCRLPLTGAGVVDVVVTELGCFDVDRGAECLRVRELADGVSLDELRAKTGVPVAARG